MNTYEIAFIKEKRTVSVEEGTNLLQAMRTAGLSPDAPCGGSGKCGKCLANIKTKVDKSWQTVKSCQTEIHENLQVETIQREASHKILVQGIDREVKVSPRLQVCNITISKCKIGESTSDWERFLQALKEALAQVNYRVCKDTKPCEDTESCEDTEIYKDLESWQADLVLLPKIAELIKKEQGKARVIFSGNHILDVQRQRDTQIYMAAFDVGTTSVAGYLLNGVTGQQIAITSALNPQTEYGADVIMRANYALEKGVDELSISIRVMLKKMLVQLCKQAEISTEEVFQVCVVGNTCMHHLFLGISPESLVLSPYNPAISQTLILSAEKYRLGVHPGAELIVLPVIAGFVGADTVGCLLAVDFKHEEKMTLMIDIGTNGEIVLGNKERRIACSTAAGPAFEGAKIACGMRGADGAIEHAQMINGKMKCSIIGNTKAAGICGSGLIDLIAELLKAGIIDESGRLQESDRTRKLDQMDAYVLYEKEESKDGKEVYLSQKDIREVQLAKGAIAAGIELMAKKLGIKIEDIEQVCIAGAFGNYMDPGSACRLGMIPPVLKDRIIPIGNAAGEGAKLALISEEELQKAEELARSTEFLELASMPEFQDQFVDELEFPESEEL